MNYEKLSKKELIDIIEILTTIRSNYEEKFGVIMYANGMTKEKTKGLMEIRESAIRAIENKK